MQAATLIPLLSLGLGLTALVCHAPASQLSQPETNPPPQALLLALPSVPAPTNSALPTSDLKPALPPGTLAPRAGDEIVVAGQFVHTGTPVVLWLDPGGYDAYRVERRFSDPGQSSWLATQESGAG